MTDASYTGGWDTRDTAADREWWRTTGRHRIGLSVMELDPECVGATDCEHVAIPDDRMPCGCTSGSCDCEPPASQYDKGDREDFRYDI